MKKTTAAALLLVAHILTVPALAGPLNPPAGAVTSTPKPLGEIEPRIAINATNTPGDNDGSPSLFKITQPGSYYLTGNITGVSGRTGIEIASSDVSIDLNGFRLAGVPGSLDGVRVPAPGTSGISVSNGTVSGWGNDGVDLSVTIASTGRNLTVTGNVNTGLLLGDNSIADACVANANGSRGILIGLAGAARGCSTADNGGDGLLVGSSSTVADCASYRNEGNGFSSGSGATFTSCAAAFNANAGFHVSIGCVVSACVSYSNAVGIDASAGSTITNNSVRFSAADGVRVSSQCLVRSNACSFNGDTADGANIHTIGVDNRIEDNICSSADRGIDVDLSGSIIIRNTCSGNAVNWTIAAGNAVAPIVQASTNAAAINGSTYLGSLGNTDPNANFSY